MNLPSFSIVWLVVYAGVFLGVLLLFEGLRQTFSRAEPAREARNRRLKMIAKGATAEDVLRLLKPERQHWTFGFLPFVGSLPTVLHQAGITTGAGRFLSLCLVVSASLAAVGRLYAHFPVAIAGGIVVGLVIPVLFVRRKRNLRIKALTAQLPDALEMMARGLRVGHPLNATIASVANDMNDPVATEFGIVLDQVSYGDDLVDAFRDFADRLDTEDLHYLATSIAIQNGTGGDLGKVLMTLASVIRARIEMRTKIRAISSEGRMTSYFLSALPIVILGVTSFTSPDYYAGVSDDPLFGKIAVAVVVLTVANFLAMRKLVNFRI